MSEGKQERSTTGSGQERSLGQGDHLSPLLQVLLNALDTKWRLEMSWGLRAPPILLGIALPSRPQRAPHSLDLQCRGFNLHLHFVRGAGEQLDCAVLAEALPVHLEENRAIVGLDAQRDGKAH